ncbi:MAG: long-chain fatty acid--CoA ligase [Thermodesulfobacteriota bacterium]
MLYGDWIGRWGKSDPHKEALVDAVKGRRYTYGDLSAEINKTAEFLRSDLEIGKGDRIAVLSFNRTEYITLFFAASRIGAILVPLNTRLAPGEFDYFIQDAGPSALFFDAPHRSIAGGIKAAGGLKHHICFDSDDTTSPPFSEAMNRIPPHPLPDIPLSADDPQLIIYTSGTTGVPKGVVMTYGMITWNAVNTHIGWDLRSEDRTVLHSALFYTAGWNIFTLPLFHARGTTLLIRGFDTDLILDLIEREKLTLFFGVPTMFQMMLESPKFERTDFSSVRFMVSGGAMLPKKVADAFQETKGIRIREGYGLTEVGPNNFLADGKPGSVGHPMLHVDVKITNETGEEVPPGAEGELLLRGDHVCAGYWNKPLETKAVIKDGWFLTGDLARIDSDGHLSIVGRKKDMYISGGINIYPAEIEKAIELHPDVAGAAVIGVFDEKWGEVGKAIVELHPGKRMTVEELQHFLGSSLGKFKIPKYLKTVDALPRTAASGKIQKFILKNEHGKPDNR